jgi:hypothetical protein
MVDVDNSDLEGYFKLSFITPVVSNMQIEGVVFNHLFIMV